MSRMSPRISKAKERYLIIAKALYRKDPNGFTQSACAKACGVAQPTLSRTFGGHDGLLAAVKTAIGLPLTAHEEIAVGQQPKAHPPVPLMAEEHPQQPQVREPPPVAPLPKGKIKVKASRNEDSDSSSAQDEQEDPFRDFPPVNASMAEHFAFASSTGLGLVFRRVLRDPSNIALGKDYTAMLSNVSKCMKEQLESTQPANLTGETVVYKDILPDNGRDENRDNVVKLGKLARKAMDNT